jgi:hypothetical protein
MDTSNALFVSQAVVTSRMAEARQDSLARQAARAAKTTRKPRRINLLQLLTPIGRLSARHP